MTDETTTEGQESQQTDGTQTAQNADQQSGADQGAKDAAKAEDTGTLDKGDTSTGDKAADKSTQKPADADSGKDEGKDKGELQQLREMLAGGDEKFLKELERYKSKESIGKAFRENKRAASERKGPMRLPDNASEDDVKAYREAYGIPEEADAYPAAFREDFQASEADTAILGEFKSAMHEANVDPAAAQAALEWYQDFSIQQKQELDGNLAKVAKQTQSELRTEWGGEYDGNIGAVQEFMTAQLGEEGFDRMMGMRLMDGSRLQDDPAFVKMMAQVATDYYGSNAIYNGDIETTAKTVQERIDETLKLRGGTKEEQEKYFSDATQAELTKLYAQRDKINARKS